MSCNSKYAIACIVRQIRKEQGVTSGSGRRTDYTFSVKREVVQVFKRGTDTVDQVAGYLKKSKLGAGWHHMLTTWINDYEKGLYIEDNATRLIRKTKPVQVGLSQYIDLNTCLLELEIFGFSFAVIAERASELQKAQDRALLREVALSKLSKEERESLGL